MRRILVAVDGTRASQAAAHVALEYAARLGARVTFLHVLPAPVAGLTGDAPDFAAFEQACRTSAEQLVGDAAKQGAAVGPQTDTAVAYGEPAQVILTAAAAEDVDLVVLGSRDRSAMARTLLGSVSAELTARCPKPVMVVPERSPGEHAPQAT